MDPLHGDGKERKAQSREDPWAGEEEGGPGTRPTAEAFASLSIAPSTSSCAQQPVTSPLGPAGSVASASAGQREAPDQPTGATTRDGVDVVEAAQRSLTTRDKLLTVLNSWRTGQPDRNE